MSFTNPLYRYDGTEDDPESSIENERNAQLILIEKEALPQGRSVPTTLGGPSARALPPEPKKKKKELLRVHDIVEDENLIYSIEYRLLTEVFDRPPLFDSSLPIADRASDIRAKLFNEICQILNREYDQTFVWNNIANSWKHHRVIYTRYTNALRCVQSGSGTTGKLPSAPKYLNVMRKYDAVSVKRSQKSSTSGEKLSMSPITKRSKNEDNIQPFLKTANEFMRQLTTKGAGPSSTITSSQIQDSSSSTIGISAQQTLSSIVTAQVVSVQPNDNTIQISNPAINPNVNVNPIPGNVMPVYVPVPSLVGTDPNLVFFQSLLPDISLLTRSDQRGFKAAILASLYGYLNGYEMHNEMATNRNSD